LTCLVSILLLDIIIKGFALGQRYFSNIMNKAECVIALIITSLVLLDSLGIHSQSHDLLKTARVITIVRLFLALRSVDVLIPQLKLANTARKAYDVILNLKEVAIIFLCFLLFFLSIGVNTFGGVINKDPKNMQYEKVLNSRYGQNNFWIFNFNDFPSGFMTLIVLLHVSDWDVISEGIVCATSKWSRLYFVTWYFIGFLFLLNVVKSFFMKGFVKRVRLAVHSNLNDSEVSNSQTGIVDAGNFRKTDFFIVNVRLFISGVESTFERYVASYENIIFLTQKELDSVVNRFNQIMRNDTAEEISRRSFQRMKSAIKSGLTSLSRRNSEDSLL
jgi:hypothetical protein